MTSQNDPDLRKKIMQIFRELAEQKGLKDTLMLDVANHLKISKKTIYRVSTSKDEMVAVRMISASINVVVNPKFLNDHRISFQNALISIQTIVVEGLKA